MLFLHINVVETGTHLITPEPYRRISENLGKPSSPCYTQLVIEEAYIKNLWNGNYKLLSVIWISILKYWDCKIMKQGSYLVYTERGKKLLSVLDIIRSI